MTNDKGVRRNKEGPDNTRLKLIEAARAEFAKLGLQGARVDAIASRAGVNKQLVYHYFGSKDELYMCVLEKAYEDIRGAEDALELDGMSPVEAMRALVEFSFDYLARNRDFVALVSDENTHEGVHLKRLESVVAMNQPVLDLIGQTLEAGVRDGVFRVGLDPYQLYLSIAGMSFFYFSNAHTLSRAFGRDLMHRKRSAERRAHIVDFTLAALAAR